MRDKCAVHKTNTAWGNQIKKDKLSAIAQKISLHQRKGQISPGQTSITSKVWWVKGLQSAVLMSSTNKLNPTLRTASRTDSS